VKKADDAAKKLDENKRAREAAIQKKQIEEEKVK